MRTGYLLWAAKEFKKQKNFDKKVNTGKHKIKPTGAKAKTAGITKIDNVKVIRCK